MVNNMKHSADLSNYNIRTDIALDVVENKKINGIKTNISKEDGVKVTTVEVDENGSKVINKGKGIYITIEFNDVTDTDNYNNVKNVFVKQLKVMLNKIGINENDLCLVIGLGNDKSTPDSLGPLSINEIIVTNHLYLLNQLGSEYRRVCTFKPGVMGENGIETSDSIKSIVSTVKPSFIIVIDALASQSIERVNKTIQMTDTGIAPGSGVGNSRKEISKEVLNVPVIAIGVPTVVDAVTIVSDTINYMYKHYSYALENKNDPLNKLRIGMPNYLDKKVNIEENKKLFGIIGDLSESETKSLIYEVLSPIDYNLMVTPKEVDFLVNKLSKLIGEGINLTLHKKNNK